MWMSHPGVTGVVTVADNAFYGGWDTMGWVAAAAPAGPPLVDAGWPVSQGEVVSLVAAAVAASGGGLTDAALATAINTGTTKTQLSATFARPPALLNSATVFVAADGDDAADALTWKSSKATIPAAIAALGISGGTVELAAGNHTVSSTGRMDTCTFTAASSTISDPSIAAGDVGAYVISPYLRSPVVIATVAPGVSFTIKDQSGSAVTPEASGTSLSIITVPAFVVPPGVTLHGRGCQWTSDTSVQTGILNHSNTWITDSGTGVTILAGHPVDQGAGNSGQQTTGIHLEKFTVKGNAGNLFGLAAINDWSVIVKDFDSVGHGLGGLLVSANANSNHFSNCRFASNGLVSSTGITAGVVVLQNTPLIPFGPVKFDNCFISDNFGWGICGTTDFVTVSGARSVWLSQVGFNKTKVSAVAGSGGHAAVSGYESRTQLTSCIFESADILCLDLYEAPVAAVACKILATGGSLGTLSFAVRINTGATLDAIGCKFLNSTSYHVQVLGTGVLNWHSCATTGASVFAADSSGNSLASTTKAGEVSGTTQNPIEPMFVGAQLARTNETFSRHLINSTAVAVVNQRLNLTYFVPSTSSTVSTVSVTCGSTASGGGATNIGVGIYSVSSSGALTLLSASPVGNANAFTSIGTQYAIALSASVWLTKGQRYAFGFLVNSGSALPTLVGIAPVSTVDLGAYPEVTKVLSAQTTLPTTVAFASLANGGAPIYARAS